MLAWTSVRRVVRQGLIRAVFGLLALGLGSVAAAATGERVETFDDGSAAVTLDGGLTVVLDRTVTRDVRDRLRRGAGLAPVIDRHARGDRARARAICAYARSRRGARLESQGDAHDRGAPACRDGAVPDSTADRLAEPAPLGTGIDGDARMAARDPAAATPSHTTDPDARPTRGQARRVRGAGVPGAARWQRPPRRPTPESAPPPRPRESGPRVPDRMPRAPRPGRPVTGAAPSPSGTSAGATRVPRNGANLPQSAGALVSSSLSTTVVGPDPVASPSGFTLR
jgi:hypothetical protein